MRKPNYWDHRVEEFFQAKLKLDVHGVRRIKAAYEAQVHGLDQYRTFYIEQYPGKRRLIEAPMPNLKWVQKVLLHRFWYKLRPSGAAHGFVVKRSPVTNAKVHARGKGPKQVLRVDVKNFFHAIKMNSVGSLANLVVRKRYPQISVSVAANIARVVSSLCCHEGRLPMGAPTSPAISNLFLAPFDKKMQKYCEKYGLAYSRYADDIIVSGRTASKAYPKIESELNAKKLWVRKKKTKVMRPHRRQKITGVVVNSGQPTVSRQVRRKIRSKIWHTRMDLEHKERGLPFNFLCMEAKPESLSSLAGWAAWIASVSPAKSHQWFREQLPELLRLKGSVS